jgi:hypothetical protein
MNPLASFASAQVRLNGPLPGAISVLSPSSRRPEAIICTVSRDSHSERAMISKSRRYSITGGWASAPFSCASRTLESTSAGIPFQNSALATERLLPTPGPVKSKVGAVNSSDKIRVIFFYLCMQIGRAKCLIIFGSTHKFDSFYKIKAKSTLSYPRMIRKYIIVLGRMSACFKTLCMVRACRTVAGLDEVQPRAQTNAPPTTPASALPSTPLAPLRSRWRLRPVRPTCGSRPQSPRSTPSLRAPRRWPSHQWGHHRSPHRENS